MKYSLLGLFALLAYTTAMCYDEKARGHGNGSGAVTLAEPHRAEQADRGVLFRPRNEMERNRVIVEVFMAAPAAAIEATGVGKYPDATIWKLAGDRK